MQHRIEHGEVVPAQRAVERYWRTVGCRTNRLASCVVNAHRELGEDDLREFHDQVLAHGSLPLATLSRELPNWVTTPA